MTVASYLTLWALSRPEQLAVTATSTVWKVLRPEGQTAILKLLHPGAHEEARGADYLRSLDGRGAVRVLARDGPAILMEWCNGPPLGDLCRNGQDARATGIMIAVIQTIHAARIGPDGLEPLADRFAPLTAAERCGDLAVAADLAHSLLDTSATEVALHGDLHHDNILQSDRGWLAIDPKGVWGDPAYECANAFRNPDGIGELMYKASRIDGLADRFARNLHLQRRRILGWAAVHCALSTVWSRAAGLDVEGDLRLLPLLLKAAETASRSRSR